MRLKRDLTKTIEALNILAEAKSFPTSGMDGLKLQNFKMLPSRGLMK